MKRKSTISIVLVICMLASMLLCMFTANAVVGSAGETVYVRTSTSGTPNCYMWKGGTNNGKWPGVAMTQVEPNVYSYKLDNAYENVIFNGGFGQTDDLTYPGDGYLWDMTKGDWELYAESEIPPNITFNKKNGASFASDTVEVTVNVTKANTASYKVDNGASQSFTDTAKVTLGAGIAVGGSTTLSVTATNEFGTTTESITLIKKEPSVVGGGDGSTSPALGGKYATNPDGQVGKKKTISIDGDKSDWDASMLIAQGTANDDPRVYRNNSMYEKPIDDYAMYAAWDDNNLYIMYEMSNVQDIVAPNDDYPITQGNLFQTENLPVFLYLYTGKGNVTDGTTVSGGTLWGSGITFDTYVDTVVAFSTNGSNGPFIYTADDDGKLDEDNIVNKNTGMKMDWGNGKTVTNELIGIDKAYGTYNNRVPGDIFDDSSAWVDFYQKGHNSKMDFFYEISIPLASLDLTASDIENTGIGVMKVSTFGMSGMDCLPYDPSMNDNADLPSTTSQEFNSHEKDDEDHITVPFARIGKLLSGDNPTTQPSTSESSTETSSSQDNPVGMMGDADNSGDVNVKDATTIQKYSAGISVNINLLVSDVTKDNTVDVRDATTIQKYCAGIVPSL